MFDNYLFVTLTSHIHYDLHDSCFEETFLKHNFKRGGGTCALHKEEENIENYIKNKLNYLKTPLLKSKFHSIELHQKIIIKLLQ